MMVTTLMGLPIRRATQACTVIGPKIQIFQDFPRLGQDFPKKAAKTKSAFLAKSWRQDSTKVADKKSWPIGVEKSPYTRQKHFSSFLTKKFGPRLGS
jgi:hypothetical protein